MKNRHNYLTSYTLPICKLLLVGLCYLIHIEASAQSNYHDSFIASINEINVSADFSEAGIDRNNTNEITPHLEKTETKQITYQENENSDNQDRGIQLSATSIPENSRPGYEIGSISVINEADDVDDYNLSLVGHSSRTNFSIEDNTLVNDVSFNFERTRSYAVRIRAQHKVNNTSFNREYIIQVTDVNERPGLIILRNKFISENNEIGQEIGTFDTFDEDANDVHTYKLDSINPIDNQFFTIVGNELRAAVHIDHESREEYRIRVISIDSGGLSNTEGFIVSVDDIWNDGRAPTDISLTNTFINENRDPDTFIGLLSAEDRDNDMGDAHSFRLNNHEAIFTISGDSLLADISLNHEDQWSYDLSITAIDLNGGKFTKEITITVLNYFDAPTDISLNNNSIAENNEGNELIDILTIEDEDLINDYSYELVENAGGRFRLVNDRIEAIATFNYEEQNQYTIRVRVRDNFLSFEKDLVIHIEDVNDSPTSVRLLNASIKEGNSYDDLVGEFYTIDEDYQDSHTYSLTRNPDKKFYIKNNQLRANAIFDFDIEDTYDITVRSLDAAGDSVLKDFTITIIAEDDRAGPVITALTPESGTTGVHPGKDLFIVTFNEPITFGKDVINVAEIDGKQIISAYPKPGSDLFHIEGSLLYITFENYAGAFVPGKNYYITISPNAIFDLAGNPIDNPILANDFSWKFTTRTKDHLTYRRTASQSPLFDIENMIQEGGENSRTKTTVIYPNPASNYITIGGVETAAIEIIDMGGKVLIESLNHKRIDISRLIEGVYIIHIQDELGSITTHRFVKRN